MNTSVALTLRPLSEKITVKNTERQIRLIVKSGSRENPTNKTRSVLSESMQIIAPIPVWNLPELIQDSHIGAYIRRAMNDLESAYITARADAGQFLFVPSMADLSEFVVQNNLGIELSAADILGFFESVASPILAVLLVDKFHIDADSPEGVKSLNKRLAAYKAGFSAIGTKTQLSPKMHETLTRAMSAIIDALDTEEAEPDDRMTAAAIQTLLDRPMPVEDEIDLL